MTGSETSDPIRDALAIADRQWRAMHIVAHERSVLADDLRTELAGAAADGLTPRQLLGEDIRGFARNLAIEAGATRIPYEDQRLLLTAAGSAAPGAVLGWFIMWGGLPLPPTLLIYAPPVLAILVGALIAVRQRMAEVPEIDRTVRAMAVLVPLTGVLITPVIMGFAALTGYSTAWAVVILEIGMAAVAVGGATLLARRWAMRSWLQAVAGVPRRP